ncbi:MAG: antA/AntB antirepressor family protein, partial [Oscillospiraceae bacterium]|nr:antA/AntB antirepressor family protein [Oscillospiraceae bacterium]
MRESTGGYPDTDHRLTIEMAKEICMIQCTDIGKKCREYFLELERRWNSPEAIIARALQFTNRQLALAKEENARLMEANAVQTRRIAELAPKASYYDVVLAC